MNKLYVNTSKSSCMKFTNRHNVPDLKINVNNTILDNETDVKYLGVHISNDLSWHVQISAVCKKLGHGIQVLRKLKGKIPMNGLIMAYTTIIQTHMDYCLTVWGYAPKYQIQRVQRLQNKIFRLITGDYSYDTSPKDILQHFNIPDVLQRRDYFNGIQVYKCINDIAPMYMSDFLHLNR